MKLGTTVRIMWLEQMSTSQKYNWLCFKWGNCNLRIK